MRTLTKDQRRRVEVAEDRVNQSCPSCRYNLISSCAGMTYPFVYVQATQRLLMNEDTPNRERQGLAHLVDSPGQYQCHRRSFGLRDRRSWRAYRKLRMRTKKGLGRIARWPGSLEGSLHLVSSCVAIALARGLRTPGTLRKASFVV